MGKGLVSSIPATLIETGLQILLQLVSQCALRAGVDSKVPGGMLIQLRVKHVRKQPVKVGSIGVNITI